MKDFEQMLEQYIDYNEMNEKLENDNEDKYELLKEKSKTKTSNNFVNTITISEFVNYYLGTEHKCKNLKHKGLKSFENPYVIGIPNTFAIKNPDCIIRNEILVVIDDYGNPGTYINPDVLKKIKTMEEYKKALNLLEKVRLQSLENINQLYTKYMEVQDKIEELRKVYLDSCDLLRCLEKRYVLKEIRKYVNEAKEIDIEFSVSRKEIDRNNDFQIELLNSIEKDFITEELNLQEIDNIEQQVNNKVNRQKTFFQRNKRGFFRKEDKK